MKSWGDWPSKPWMFPSPAFAALTRAYTDGHAEEAVKIGGGGVFIKLCNGSSIRKSVASGQQSAKYRAVVCALLTAAQTSNQEERLPANTVFLTDPSSSLQSPGGLQILSSRPYITTLWCGKQRGSRSAAQGKKQVGAICTPNVLQWSKGHPKKQHQDTVATTPNHWNRWGQRPPTG